MDYEEVKRIKRKFVEEHGSKFEWNGIGISKVVALDANASDEEKSDLCIMVGMDPIPSELPFPSVYEGVKVYAKKVGRARAL